MQSDATGAAATGAPSRPADATSERHDGHVSRCASTARSSGSASPPVMTANTSFSERQAPTLVVLSHTNATDATVSPGQDERVTTSVHIWAAAIAAAHARWPSDWLSDDVFIEHLRARIAAEADPTAALSRLAVADLYLACACARGVAPAIEAFDRTILREVDAHVASFDRSP